MRYLIGNEIAEPREVEVTAPDGAGYRVRVGDGERALDAFWVAPGLLSVLIDGRSYDVEVELSGERATVAVRGHVFDLHVRDARHSGALASVAGRGSSGPEEIRSPMPGRIVRVLQAVGDPVVAGDGIVVVEAMKMENELHATRDGTVTAIHAQEGSSVDAGALLAVLE